jgi:hypothetical protein
MSTRILPWLMGALCGLVLATAAADEKKKTEPATCGGYGTAVDFLDSPTTAAKKAAQEQKLVFVLHVSGNFEDPQFT